MPPTKKKGKSLEVVIEFNNDRYNITTTTKDTLKGLKNLIFAVTGVPVYRQVLPNSRLKGYKSDRTILKDLEITNKSILKIKDLINRPLLPRFTQTGNANNGIPMIVNERASRSKNYMKIIGKPRKGKKLAVVDVDHTIFDIDAPNANVAGRPFLQEFLSKVYEEYDIAIWSSTVIEWLEYKIETLGLDRHPGYKLLLYLDIRSSISILQSSGVLYAKPLTVIWKKFPQYNRKNTVICDDCSDNFYFNQKNGILVEPYFFQNYHTDEELYKLSAYLKSISTSDDLSLLDHNLWQLNSDASESNLAGGNNREGGSCGG